MNKMTHRNFFYIIFAACLQLQSCCWLVTFFRFRFFRARAIRVVWRRWGRLGRFALLHLRFGFDRLFSIVEHFEHRLTLSFVGLGDGRVQRIVGIVGPRGRMSFYRLVRDLVNERGWLPRRRQIGRRRWRYIVAASARVVLARYGHSGYHANVVGRLLFSESRRVDALRCFYINLKKKREEELDI